MSEWNNDREEFEVVDEYTSDEDDTTIYYDQDADEQYVVVKKNYEHQR